MAFGACIFGFQTCCRPAIATNRTHLKGKCKGVLFIALTMDGNDHIFPIAFGVTDIKNDRSWTWFLREAYNVIGSPRDLIIISDRHISIKNTDANVFPNVAHGLCGFHMKNNISNTYKNSHVTTLFVNASRVYRKDEFIGLMKVLKVVKPKAHDKLIDNDVCKWSLAYYLVRRYSLITVECGDRA